MADIYRSCANDLQTNFNWGMPDLIKTKCVEKRAAAAASSPSKSTDSSTTTTTDYRLNGKLTIRFPSIADWNKNSDKMKKSPLTYLHLSDFKKISQIYTAADNIETLRLSVVFHPESSLSESMRKLLEQAPTDGDVIFIAGKQRQRIHAHELVVKMATPRDFFPQGSKEGVSKEADVSHIPVEVFKAFLTYCYLRSVADTVLAKHAAALLVLGNENLMPDLFEKCEAYLCWNVQVFFCLFIVSSLFFFLHFFPLQTQHYTLDVPAMLILADLHKARALKEICIECIFFRGPEILQQKSFEDMPSSLMMELLRDNAARREVRSQFVVRDDSDDAGKRELKRLKTG
jgi:hypothetical protein